MLSTLISSIFYRIMNSIVIDTKQFPLVRKLSTIWLHFESISASKSNIDKLQRLQNSLARAVMCTAKFDSITPVLAALHWLPINACITFKVALITRKVLTTQQPGYLLSLIRVNQPTRQLRPSTHRVLCSRAPRTAFARRAFCHAAPAVRNKLPNHLNVVHSTVSLSEFKRNLKSFLYKLSFPIWSRDWSAPAILL